MTPEYLRAAREAANLTKYRLAKLAGIQRGDLGQMEAGRRVIGPGMAARLREALEKHSTNQGKPQ
jgi:transcriptional regulator with XRE-family HTH domain